MRQQQRLPVSGENRLQVRIGTVRKALVDRARCHAVDDEHPLKIDAGRRSIEAGE